MTQTICNTNDARKLPNDWDRSGLPAWAYTSEELFDLETDALFRRHWQLAGHIANIPKPGDYFCFDMLGERALIVRGKDDIVRAFHNVCRHRGSRVVAEDCGSRSSAFVCPFHGWSFNLDGTFRSAPQPRSFPPLDPVEHGLKPLDFDIWNGFIFVRFQQSDQPSISDILARFDDEIAAYRCLDVVPTRTDFWTANVPVNWKAVRDVDNEGYHVPIAHPALQELYGKSYFDEPYREGASRSFATFDEDPARLWSVRNYKAMLPNVEHLPESHRRAWLYIGVFPNAVLTFYPESIGFYQEIPLSSGQSLLRGADYILPGEDRQMQLARYLGERINRDTMEEDVQLTIWSYEAARSSGYQGIILSDLEAGVRSHHDELRKVMPVLNDAAAPAPGTMRSTNAGLRTV